MFTAYFINALYSFNYSINVFSMLISDNQSERECELCELLVEFALHSITGESILHKLSEGEW